MGTPKTKSEFLSETAKSFVFEKAAEYLTGNRTEIYGRALDWGKEHEKEAFHYFQQQTDDFYTYYGAETYTFITYGLWGGYSPDALGEKLIEIKCPFNSGNHLQNFFIKNNEQLKSKRTEYYWQIMSLVNKHIKQGTAKKLVDTDDTLMYELGAQSPIHPTILEALKPFGIK